jgi:hypothetical protein
LITCFDASRDCARDYHCTPILTRGKYSPGRRGTEKRLVGGAAAVPTALPSGLRRVVALLHFDECNRLSIRRVTIEIPDGGTRNAEDIENKAKKCGSVVTVTTLPA